MKKLEGLSLISLVNTGGFCKIYKAKRIAAFDVKDQGNLLAIKILKKQYTGSPPHIFTIENEHRITRDLNHKSISPSYDLLKSGMLIALTRKFINAPSMKICMEKNQLGVAEKIKSIISLAEALNYLHAEGVIHGDIKPSNVLILQDSSIKLIDFGVAENINCISPRLAYSYSRVYSSPEKIMGFGSDFRDDVYSFGRVALKFLFDQPPMNYELVGGFEKNYTEAFPEIIDLKLILLECISRSPKKRPCNGILLYRKLKEIFY